MRRARSQREWQRALKEDPEVLGLRCDGYSNLLRVANLIVWGADWATMCSRPTITRIVDVTGLARSTVKRWVRWLRERGWLGVVEQGSTCRYRKGTARPPARSAWGRSSRSAGYRRDGSDEADQGLCQVNEFTMGGENTNLEPFSFTLLGSGEDVEIDKPLAA